MQFPFTSLEVRAVSHCITTKEKKKKKTHNNTHTTKHQTSSSSNAHTACSPSTLLPAECCWALRLPGIVRSRAPHQPLPVPPRSGCTLKYLGLCSLPTRRGLQGSRTPQEPGRALLSPQLPGVSSGTQTASTGTRSFPTCVN